MAGWLVGWLAGLEGVQRVIWQPTGGRSCSAGPCLLLNSCSAGRPTLEFRSCSSASGDSARDLILSTARSAASLTSGWSAEEKKLAIPAHRNSCGDGARCWEGGS